MGTHDPLPPPPPPGQVPTQPTPITPPPPPAPPPVPQFPGQAPPTTVLPPTTAYPIASVPPPVGVGGPGGGAPGGGQPPTAPPPAPPASPGGNPKLPWIIAGAVAVVAAIVVAIVVIAGGNDTTTSGTAPTTAPVTVVPGTTLPPTTATPTTPQPTLVITTPSTTAPATAPPTTAAGVTVVGDDSKTFSVLLLDTFQTDTTPLVNDNGTFARVTGATDLAAFNSANDHDTFGITVLVAKADTVQAPADLVQLFDPGVDVCTDRSTESGYQTVNGVAEVLLLDGCGTGGLSAKVIMAIDVPAKNSVILLASQGQGPSNTDLLDFVQAVGESVVIF